MVELIRDHRPVRSSGIRGTEKQVVTFRRWRRWSVNGLRRIVIIGFGGSINVGRRHIVFVEWRRDRDVVIVVPMSVMPMMPVVIVSGVRGCGGKYQEKCECNCNFTKSA
jgi:hypothetical protein